MRAQTVQEGSIRSPTFSKPVGPRARMKRDEGSTNGVICLISTCSGVSEQGGPQRPPMQHPT
jgi:hypothetical protein